MVFVDAVDPIPMSPGPFTATVIGKLLICKLLVSRRSTLKFAIWFFISTLAEPLIEEALFDSLAVVEPGVIQILDRPADSVGAGGGVITKETGCC